jgi:aspartate racemase
MKKLGIIGGLGPMATAYFLELIVKMTEASNDQEHIEVLLHSCPQIPDRTKYILGQSGENPEPQMRAIGQSLAAQGAQVIAIPCITAHFFQQQLEQEIGCPIIHGIEETALTLKQEGISRAGILATDGTIESGLFPQIFSRHNIECLTPDPENQSKVMHIIYDDVKAGRPIEMNLFNEAADALFSQGAQVVLLGCTELSMVKCTQTLAPGFLDVMEVLARRAVTLCGRLKSEYTHLITE